MADTRYLVHGVFWDGPPPVPAPGSAEPDGGHPALRLQDPAGVFTALALDAGTRLGFRLDFHRGGRVPAGLRAYLMQPHWLYIATFANGASKVGTAAHLRKWKRLAEQGAVVARYVARADDGRIVRLLEDLVTRDAGLPQQVRSAAKAAALEAPAAAVELDALNRRLAGKARTLLAGAGGGGFEVLNERWERPKLSATACAPAARHAYPHDLVSGRHGFRIESLSGSVALAALDGSELEFVVNLGQLKARTIHLGDYGSAVPAVQEALF